MKHIRLKTGIISSVSMLALMAAPAFAEDRRMGMKDMGMMDMGMMEDKGMEDMGMTMMMGKAHLRVGGFFTQGVAAVDADEPTGQTAEEHAILQNSEIHFNGKAKLDGGTTIGIRVELEGTTKGDADLVDEHYLYAKGDWGKVILGAENGAAHLGSVRGPNFVPGLPQYDNSLTDNVIEDAYDALFGEGVIEDENMSTKIEHISGDANKITYFSPRLSGFQFGVSYTPNNQDDDGGESNFSVRSDVASGSGTQEQQDKEVLERRDDVEDIFEFSLSYKMSLMGGSLKLGYSQAEGDAMEATSADPKSYGYGANFHYGAFRVGGNMTTYEDFKGVSGNDIETVNYGISYQLSDNHIIGVGYTDSEEDSDNPNATGRDRAVDYEEFLIGGGMSLAKGVKLGYFYQEAEAEVPGQRARDVSLAGITVALKF